MNAESVLLARPHVGQITMPDEAVDFAQPDPGLVPVNGEETELHQLGDLGEDREVGSRTIPGRSEWVSSTRPHAHQETLYAEDRRRPLQHSGQVKPPRQHAERDTWSRHARLPRQPGGAEGLAHRPWREP